MPKTSNIDSNKYAYLVAVPKKIENRKKIPQIQIFASDVFVINICLRNIFRIGVYY